jgi:hypothetical protein
VEQRGKVVSCQYQVQVGAVMSQEILTKDRRMLIDVLRSVIEQMESSPEWNDRQLDYLYHAFRRIEGDNSSFLSYSQEDPKKVSYAREMKYRFDNKRRVRTTLGRYFRRNEKVTQEQIPDRLLAQVTDLVFATRNKVSGGNVQILRGEAVQEAYRNKIGAGSCMTGGCADYVEIYKYNPDKVGIAIYCGNLARGLLWTTDCGATILDRIYASASAFRYALIDWGLEQGFLVVDTPERNSPFRKQWQGLKGQFKVTLDDSQCQYYPYMDTFFFGKHKQIKNGKGWVRRLIVTNQDTGSFRYRLESTGGHLCGGYCSDCEDSVGTDAYEIDGRLLCNYCYEQYEECDRCYENRRRDNMTRIRDIDEIWCDDCAYRYAVRCPGCCNYIEEAHEIEDDSRKYCEDCRERMAEECDGCNKWFSGGLEESTEGNLLCSDCRTSCDGCGDIYMKKDNPLINELCENCGHDCECGTRVDIEDMEEDGCPECGAVLTKKCKAA